MNLPPFKHIKNHSSWHECLTQLQQEPRLAIDLEANSLYAYRERVCLIQISTEYEDFLVDPLALDERHLSFLGDICANERPPWQEAVDGKRFVAELAKRDITFEETDVTP